ncbi:DUF992 domain-containing protein [Stappia sp. F7233]|uniref:DUF992 domain-containing protein n=1 Tax=Stappia albiluteola TaxID=2758565 RepID=A0A839AFM5_9HYPH|nr:DUF992 domain-containing protein [Stappia albiluteola]MBA5777896.1 DUF992 domain-containing protein [Stappia albiluteola]
MHRLVVFGLALFALPAAALAQSSAPGVQVGVLSCEVEGGSGFIFGSTKGLQCTFDKAGGGKESYKGTINEFGLDIGTVKEAKVVWAVLAPSADMKPGALAGKYAGVSAGATLGVGLEANALIGGLDRSIALNPLSLGSTQGFDIQAGLASLTLTHQ